MENTTTTPNTTANAPMIGKRREGINLEERSGSDPWAEAPFYALSQDGSTGSEHLLPWTVGGTLAGIFRGLRVANKSKSEAEQRDYAVFETDDGDKFRAYAAGQMKYQLDNNIAVGEYVEITYLGKEYVDRLKKEVHQFKVVGEARN